MTISNDMKIEHEIKQLNHTTESQTDLIKVLYNMTLTGKCNNGEEEFIVVKCPSCGNVMVRRKSHMNNMGPCWFCKIQFKGEGNEYTRG